MTTKAKLPLTSKKHGSTRCVECGKLFTATPDMPTVETEATELVGGRPGWYLPTRPVAVRRLWHAACLERFEAFTAAYRDQVRADNEALIESLRA